jgi:hypothetical protein
VGDLLEPIDHETADVHAKEGRKKGPDKDGMEQIVTFSSECG